MDIQKEREAFESNFKKTEIYRRECAIRGKDILEFSKTMGGYFNIVANDAWNMWQLAKAKAVPEKDAIIKKLSDQLYSQEMKTSAARTLCETACELLDDYAHQDAMVILNDLEQAMIEAQEPNND